MLPPIVTFTTDFGTGSPYVAQMKAVLLTRLPGASVVDVTHAVPPQEITAAAIWLADSLAWFPDHAVHVAVVDPGVGTQRRIIAGRCRGGRFVGPDNGLFSLCEIERAVALENPAFWLPQVSRTFHGRDIMTPVAAAIADGVPLEDLGPPVTDWQTLSLPEPVRRGDQLIGQVITVDSFGNLITNLTAELLHGDFQVTVDGQATPWVRCYGEAHGDDLVALIGSAGRLEIAVVNGSAERRIGRAAQVVVVRR